MVISHRLRAQNRPRKNGTVLIILMMVVFVLSLSLMVAMPFLQTELQREKEEELIFRGRQYVEAVRLFQMKNPGRFPSSLKELIEGKFIRKLYKDPMTKNGEWMIILNSGPADADSRSGGIQKILVAPESALSAIGNPLVLGVTSSSTNKSIRLYEQQTHYNKWLFYYGHDPQKQPKIIIYGQNVESEENPKEE